MICPIKEEEMRSTVFWAFFIWTQIGSLILGQQQTVDFEQFSGPSVFTGVQPPLTVDLATFSGGQILSRATNLPANQTTVYGTAIFCSGCLPTITIDFSEAVSEFSVFVMNGQTFTVNYMVEDDQGGMSMISLVANFQSGAGTVSLPSTGIHMVSITSDAGGNWDFLIDNVKFSAAGCVIPAEGAVTEPVPGGLSCGSVDADVLLYSQEDDDGNRVQLFCADRDPFLDEFALDYVPAVDPSRQVGRCPWVGGQNDATITHAGDNDNSGKTDCFVRTFWRSVEPGRSQGVPLLKDWKTFNFDVAMDRLVLKHYASIDGPGGLFGDILIKSAVDIDPLDFNPNPQQDEGPPMTTTIFEPCDVDRDSDCDAADLRLLLLAVGQCEDGDSYNEIADADHDGCVTIMDESELFASILSDIDIKPSSLRNTLNPANNGVIPVAILTSETFDAATVDPASVQFGPNGAGRAHRTRHLEDVDGDGDLDLLLHFKTLETGIQCGDTSGLLVGMTFEGQFIQGSDTINTVGCQ